MSSMKKHPFLHLDYRSTIKLPHKDEAQMLKWLKLAGEVLEHLYKKKIIPVQKVQSIHVSLLICGDTRIRELNRNFRNKDKVTDVLSFPAYDNLRTYKSKMPELFLGDLAICHTQTRRQSKKFEISYFDEFIHLFFHGIIHLMGYDHEISAKEENLMELWEQKALLKFSELKKKGTARVP